jgi:hypothetical protein
VAWLKAGIVTAITMALLIVAALMLLSIFHQGIEPGNLALIVVVGLPAALATVAPVCLVVLPIADGILMRTGARLFRDMAIVGATGGVLTPLLVMFGLRIRPAGMIGTVTGLLLLAGLVAGLAAGLFYAEVLDRQARR